MIVIKTGLILEGGAMRGMFTAGVTDVMMENGITFDGAIGVSAGAAFGCNYKSNQPGRSVRYNLRFCRDKRYCSVRSLIKTGNLYGADFCYHEIPDKLDVFDKETYNASPMEFYVVCTDALTGKAVYKSCDKADNDCYEFIRASASMPIVSRPVSVGGYTLLDGGMADPIPVKYFESIGYDRNVVVLTQPDTYVKKAPSGLRVMKRLLRKYPEIYTAVATRHIGYNETVSYIREKEKRGEIFVIRPSAPLGIGKTEHDPKKIQSVYDIGRTEAEKNLAALKEYLKR